MRIRDTTIPLVPEKDDWWQNPDHTEEQINIIQNGQSDPKWQKMPRHIKNNNKQERKKIPPLMGTVFVENRQAQRNVDAYIKKQNESTTRFNLVKKIFVDIYDNPAPTAQ